jgi:hypothetical protein
MSVFPNWTRFAVHQKRPNSGCIPTGCEMILRASGAEGIDYDTFQDDFDFDIELNEGETTARNNFVSVGDAIHRKYPWVMFRVEAFKNGTEKIAFVDSKIALHQPILLSVAMSPLGGHGWHIMPVVDANDDQYLLLEYVRTDKTADCYWFEKRKLVEIHDQNEGGKDVCFLASLNSPIDLNRKA